MIRDERTMQAKIPMHVEYAIREAAELPERSRIPIEATAKIEES